MTEFSLSHPEIINPSADAFETIQFPDTSDTRWKGGGYTVSASKCRISSAAKFVRADGVTAIRRIVETVGGATDNIPPEQEQRSYQIMLLVEPEKSEGLPNDPTVEDVELYTVDTDDVGKRLVRRSSVSRRDREIWLTDRERLSPRSSILLPQDSVITLLWVQGRPIADERQKPQNTVPNFAKDMFLNMWDIKRLEKLTPIKALGRLLVSKS